jgi:hypothetical protein
MLLLIAKIFATFILSGFFLSTILYIYIAQHRPTIGKGVQTVSGLIVGMLSLYGIYYLWAV